MAETGPEGLTLARDLRPDVIILDINLPGMDGFEVKARLAEDALTRGVPVLALSARAAFAEYLTKPLQIPALVEALSRALAPTSATSTSAADAA